MTIGDKNEPIDLVVVEPCVVEGKHLALGTVLKKQDPEFAFEMAACGKMRLATEDLVKDMKARAKAEEEAKQARAAQSGGFVLGEAVATGSGVSSEDIKAAISQGIAAGMQAVAEQLAAAPEDISGGNGSNAGGDDAEKAK